MSDAMGVFEVAMTGDDERRIAKVAQDEKVAAATYDVREGFGGWLFGAADSNAFNDRFAMSYNDIARTIEPHIHAGRGVIAKVSKALFREWRQRQADNFGEPVKPNLQNTVEHTEPTLQVEPGTHPDEAFARAREHRRHQAAPGVETPMVPPSPGQSVGAPPPSPSVETPAQGSPTPGAPLPPTPAHMARRMLAELENEEGHPEQHIQKTFQDHQGEELIPEGNFEGYKDRVDQGGPSKVDANAFIPGEHTDRHDSSGSDNFVPTVTGSRELQHLSRLLHADDMSAPPAAPGAAGPGGDMGPGMDPSGGAAGAPPPAPAPGATPPPMSAGAAPAGPPPPAGGPPPVTASREFQVLARMLFAEDEKDDDESDPNDGFGGKKAKPFGSKDAARRKAHNWAIKVIREQGTIAARQRLVNAAKQAGVFNDAEYTAFSGMFKATRKMADRNYLQQADEAITKVLNEKAEEFQNTIAPLQQALITIQQAEQLQNPLNVQPPAGTVNVLPQGAQGNPAPGGDPAAGAPQGAGGLGADPAAAALAGQPQQMAASRRRAYRDDDEGSDEFQRRPESPWEEVAPGWHQDMSSPSESYHHESGGYVAPLSSGQGWKAQHSRHPDDYSAPLPSREHAMAAIEQGQPATGWTGGHTGSRHPFDRRRAGGIEDEFDTFEKRKPGLSSSPAVDVENFVQQKQAPNKGNVAKPGAPATGKPRFGPKAINKLKQKQGLPPEMQIGPSGGGSYGISARRRRADAFAEPGYTWSKAPATVKEEFGARTAKGKDPESVFREMIAEITKHHEGGLIGSHDAHRAANEALGRLMLARKRRATYDANNECDECGAHFAEPHHPSCSLSDDHRHGAARRSRRPLGAGGR